MLREENNLKVVQNYTMDEINVHRSIDGPYVLIIDENLRTLEEN